MLFLLAASVVTFGLAAVQPNNEVITNIAIEPGKTQQDFFNFFESIGKNDPKQRETYRSILEGETRREQQAFDSMKDEWRSARFRSGKQRQSHVALKREAKKTSAKMPDGKSPFLVVDEDMEEPLTDFQMEDREKMERFKLSDISRKALRFTFRVVEDDLESVEPKVQSVLSGFIQRLKKLKEDIISLRDDVGLCGDTSGMSTGSNSWRQVFEDCLISVNTELLAVQGLSRAVSTTTEIIKDFRWELHLRSVEKAPLQKAVQELSFAKDLVSKGNSRMTVECPRTMKNTPDAVNKYGEAVVLAHDYFRLQLHRLENCTREVVQRLLTDE